MDATAFPAFAAALGLALVHLFAGKLRFLSDLPRNRWLSFAGGISVAYVFLHLIPVVSEAQKPVAEAVGPFLGSTQHHLNVVSLLGLAAFYGLERLAEGSRERQREQGNKDQTSAGIFWLHISAFAVYNLLIGYVLVNRPEQTMQGLLLFFVAMALHFVVNDFGLQEHHQAKYAHAGRWILSFAVLLGWAVGSVTEVTKEVLGVLIAFLAGGIILNVFKDELPKARKSRFWAFVLGLAGYSALLLVA